jgi:curved DNA-binding protein CbpA
MPESGYINYYELLGLTNGAKPGEARNAYKKRIKSLIADFTAEEQTRDRVNAFVLEMAQLNAAVYVLRDNTRREAYWAERTELIALEEEWVAMGDISSPESDALRRDFDTKIRAFLSKYVEEMTLEAGTDKHVVEASQWGEGHARHATRLLRLLRHNLYHQILERLPYHQVTRPQIDWTERQSTVAELIAGESR